MARANLLTRPDVDARLTRLSAGRYELDGEFLVERHPDGWRWFRIADPSVGGEWRFSKREAVRDLTEFLNVEAR